MSNAVTTQTRFQWFDDDAGANAASSKASINNNWTPGVSDLDVPIRLRAEIANTGGKAESAGNYVLRMSVDGGAYVALTPSSENGAQSIASAYASDGDNTTERMSGSQAFQVGDWDSNGSTDSVTLQNGYDTELEFCFKLDSAYLSGGAILRFRVYRGNTSLDGYTNTPLITAPTPAAGTIEQGSFRFRPEGAEEAVNDNAAEDWEAALDIDVTLDMMTIHGGLLTKLRAELIETGSASKTIIPKLQYRINAGAWTTPRSWNYLDPGAESGTYDAVMIVNKATTVDGAATANILSGSGLTFVAGTMEHSATAASVTLNNQHTEIEWQILISRFYNTRNSVNDGDTIDFRIVESDDTLLDGTYDYPRITVNIPAGYIGGTGIETSQNFSFIKIPDGTLYGVIEDAELNANIMMLQSLDGGVSWNPVDTGIDLVQPDMESWSMAYDDTRKVIHCLHVGNEAEYYQFGTKDHSTDPDQWIQIAGSGNLYHHQLKASLSSTNQSAEIILRGSTLCAFYPDDTSPEVIYYRMKSDTSTANNWGSEVILDTTGGTTDFSGVSVVLGVQDDGGGAPLIHVFYSDHSNLNIHHRTINTSETLGPIHTVTADMDDGGAGLPMGLTNAICWESGGSEYAMIGFSDGTSNYLRTVIVQDDGTPDSAQIASNNVVVLDNPDSVNARQPVASLGLDGTTAWVFYADDSTMDLWRASNADGAGWTGHAEELDGVTVHAIRGQVFTHSAGNGGATVFGFIRETELNQGGTPLSGYEGTNRYDEYVITPGGGGEGGGPAIFGQIFRNMRT